MCLKHQKDMYWYAQVRIKLILNYLSLDIPKFLKYCNPYRYRMAMEEFGRQI